MSSLAEKYANQTVEQLEQQLNILKTLDEASEALDEFSNNVSTFTGKNLGEGLSDDKSVEWLFGELKPLITDLEAIAEPYEKLTEGASLAGDVSGHVETINNLVKAFKDGEALSGSEKAEALADIVDGLPGLAESLTGLAGLNPVLGVFLLLYGEAIRSAAVVIADIEERHDEQMEIIRSRGEIDVDAELAAIAESEDRRARAQQALDDEYNAALDAYLAKRMAQDATSRLIATKYCLRIHASDFHKAQALASGYLPSNAVGIDETTDVHEDDLVELDQWLEGITSDLTDAYGRGDVETARTLTDLKYDVLDLVKPIKNCIVDRLYWMDEHEGFTKDGPKPRRTAMLVGGGIFGVSLLIGAFVVLPLGDTTPNPATNSELTQSDDSESSSADLDEDSDAAGNASDEPAVDAAVASEGACTEPVSIDDPVDDLEVAFQDGTLLENPDPGGDLTSMSVQGVEGGLEVALTFNGDPTGIEERTGQWFSFDLLFFPDGDGARLNVIYDRDGSIKISDAPAGTSVTADLSDANFLLVTLFGVECQRGARLTLSTIQTDTRGTSSDRADLVIP